LCFGIVVAIRGVGNTGVKLIEANFGTSAIRIFNRFQVFFQF
jgi:hypothetical protein